MTTRSATVAASLAALALAPAPAQATWQQPVDSTSPINLAPDRNGFSPYTTAIDGVPHVAWTEYDGVNTEVRVARLNATGDDWEEIVGGPSPVNHDSSRSAARPVLASAGGTLYLAWAENDGVNDELRVARLNAAGTDWEEIEGGSSPINHAPGRSAEHITMAAIGGVPYVAWSESDGQRNEVRVSRLTPAGTAWEEVVGGTSPVNVSPFDAGTPSLADVGGVPHVAWSESDAASREIRVARLSAAGTAWQEIVGGASPINHDPSRSALSPDLRAIDGVLHVAWRESDPTNDEIRVSRLDAAAGDWVQIGGGPSPVNQSSTADALEPALTAIGGVPYVAWREYDGTNHEARVARLNPSGAAWEQVVGGASPINARADRNAAGISLTAVGGVPYIGWYEFDDANYEVRVKRLAPELSAPQSLASRDGAVLLTQVRSHGVPYPVAFEYGAGGGLGSRTAVTTSSDGEAATDTIFAAVGGLSPGTGYSYRAIGFDGRHAIGAGPPAQFATLAADGPVVAGEPTIVAGEPPPARLLVAVIDPALRARPGKRVRVAYLSTGEGNVALEVLKGKRRVARVTGRARLGRNVIAWNGKQGRKKAKPGRYTLRLSVSGGDGQAASDGGKVTVKR